MFFSLKILPLVNFSQVKEQESLNRSIDDDRCCLDFGQRVCTALATHHSVFSLFVRVRSSLFPLAPILKKKLGVAKRAHLFFFDAALAADYKLSLGFVGSGGRRLCLKPVVTKDQKG